MNQPMVAFIDVVPEASGKRRLYFANQLTDVANLCGVEVLEIVITPVESGIVAAVFAKAPDRAAFEAALAPADGVYSHQIAEIKDLVHNPKSAEPELLMVAARDAAAPDRNLAAFDAPDVRLKASLGEGSPFGHAWLATSALPFDAQVHMEAASGNRVWCLGAMSAQTYVDLKRSGPREDSSPPSAAPAEALQPGVAAGSGSYTVQNVGETSFWAAGVASPGELYKDLQQSKYEIIPSATWGFGDQLYLWKSQPGVTTIGLGGFPYIPGTKPLSTVDTPTNYCPPTTIVPFADGAQFAISLSKGVSVNTVTPMSTLINAILNTTQHDEGWPEDSYTGGYAAAYAYILSKIPDETPPNTGRVKYGIVDVITYPGGDDFTEAEFEAVKKHLLLEITYFAYVQDWFGANGVLTVMNLEVVTVGTDALIAVQALMTVKDESLVALILELIFGAIINAISAIPEIGPIIAAVLRTAFTTLTTLLTKNNLPLSINTTVAQLADELTTYLGYLDKTTADQGQTVGGDWGKLKAFATGVIDGTISADKLGVTFGASTTAATGRGNPKVDPSYTAALDKGWKISFFQALFYDRFSPSTMITPYGAGRTYDQPWNPDNGNYQYVYAIPTVIEDTNGNKTDWTFLCSCYPNGDDTVHEALFKSAQLGVDPISFFLGLDGWRYVEPILVQGPGSPLSGGSKIVSMG